VARYRGSAHGKCAWQVCAPACDRGRERIVHGQPARRSRCPIDDRAPSQRESFPALRSGRLIAADPPKTEV